MQAGKSLILAVLDSFSGKEGEPQNQKEIYILKAMWVMMLSEFEATIKLITESYIDEIKKKDISEIHICLLVNHFYPNAETEEKLTLDKIISCYSRNPKEIVYRHFTEDKVPKYKATAVERLFNKLGIFFSAEEKMELAALNPVATTRDAIAHGDRDIQITRKQLEGELENLYFISKMLKNKLK